MLISIPLSLLLLYFADVADGQRIVLVKGRLKDRPLQVHALQMLSRQDAQHSRAAAAHTATAILGFNPFDHGGEVMPITTEDRAARLAARRDARDAVAAGLAPPPRALTASRSGQRPPSQSQGRSTYHNNLDASAHRGHGHGVSFRTEGIHNPNNNNINNIFSGSGVRGPRPGPGVSREAHCVWCGASDSILLGCRKCPRCFCFKCFQRRPGHGINNWSRAVKDPKYECVICRGLENEEDGDLEIREMDLSANTKDDVIPGDATDTNATVGKGRSRAERAAGRAGGGGGSVHFSLSSRRAAARVQHHQQQEGSPKSQQPRRATGQFAPFPKRGNKSYKAAAGGGIAGSRMKDEDEDPIKLSSDSSDDSELSSDSDSEDSEDSSSSSSSSSDDEKEVEEDLQKVEEMDISDSGSEDEKPAGGTAAFVKNPSRTGNDGLHEEVDFLPSSSEINGEVDAVSEEESDVFTEALEEPSSSSDEEESSSSDDEEEEKEEAEEIEVGHGRGGGKKAVSRSTRGAVVTEPMVHKENRAPRAGGKIISTNAQTRGGGGGTVVPEPRRTPRRRGKDGGGGGSGIAGDSSEGGGAGGAAGASSLMPSVDLAAAFPAGKKVPRELVSLLRRKSRSQARKDSQDEDQTVQTTVAAAVPAGVQGSRGARIRSATTTTNAKVSPDESPNKKRRSGSGISRADVEIMLQQPIISP